MDRTKILTTGLCAAFAVLAQGGTVYTITTDAGNTFDSPQLIDQATVTVDDGSSTVTKPFPEVKDSFVAGSVFRKRGEGYLKASSSMFGFTGEIRIEEGGYMVITNRCLGPTIKEQVNAVVVSNGASIVICPTLATCPNDSLRMYNPVTFGGEGYEGRGAICYSLGDGYTLQNQGFSGNWSLTADATVGIYSAGYVNHPSLRYLYLNGHALVIRQKDKAGTFVVPQGVIAGGAGGTVIFDGSDIKPLIQDTNRDWWNGSAVNNFVLTNGADMVWYIFQPRPWWSLEVNEGSFLTVSGKATYPCNLGTSDANDSWGGPLRINADMFSITGGAPDQGAWWLGPVSGRGGIYAKDLWLKLSCATNSFEGPVVVSYNNKYDTGLALYTNGAMPANNAHGITVTNATTYLGAAEVFTLPKLSYEVASGRNCISGLATRVSLPSIQKTGAGTLDVSTIPVSVSGETKVLAGSLYVNGAAAAAADAGSLYSAVPGLWCGISPDGTGAAADSTIVYSNFVDSCFAMMSQHTYPPWISGRPTIWGGYIWNRSPTNETWTFAISVRAMGRVYVDGVALTVNDDYNNAARANKVMSPGPHLFRFAVNPRTSTPGSGVPSIANGWTWAPEMGIAIDRYGRMSKNSADYFFPSNNVIAGASGFTVEGGDGSLFTRDARERSAFTEAELAAALRATNLGKVTLGASTTLDLGASAGAAPLPLTDLTGGGTITNGSVLVAGTWTLTLADSKPVELKVTGGDLTFGSSAVIDCDVTDLKTKSSGYVIVSASGSLTGLPARSGRLVENGWKLTVNDGRQLVLFRPTGMMISVR